MVVGVAHWVWSTRFFCLQGLSTSAFECIDSLHSFRMDFSKDSLELSMDHSTLPKETEDKSESNNLLSIFVCYFAVSKFKLNTPVYQLGEVKFPSLLGIIIPPYCI